jgi:hypothetical protein
MNRVCTVCNRILDEGAFYLDTRYVSHRVTICKACMKNRTKQRRYNFRPMRKMASYKEAARRRGVSFTLSKFDFLELWQKPCRYCGSKIDTIGLDRVNNDRGYIRGNVVPCCHQCNSMKGKLSYVRFVRHCRNIVEWANASIARGE